MQTINPRATSKIHKTRGIAHRLIVEIIFKISNPKEIRKEEKKTNRKQWADINSTILLISCTRSKWSKHSN